LKTIAKEEVIKRIFASSLEADILVDMVGVFTHVLNPVEAYSDNLANLA
jgi:hypothetical protein